MVGWMWFVLGVIATLAVELCFTLWLVLRSWEDVSGYNVELDRYREGE